MYNIDDKQFMDRLSEEFPEIYDHIRKINNDSRINIRNGCHDISNIISLVYGDYQLLALKHHDLADDERWQMLGNDIRNLIDAMRSIGEYRYSDVLELSDIHIKPYISELGGIICSKTNICQSQLITDYNTDNSVISIDKDKINYVILSLVNNILDINRHAGIQLSAYTDESNLYICVTDSLGGVSSDIRTRLFEPFNSDKTNHIGLSLATSYQILLNHNGELSYRETHSHSGSGFTLRLPTIK